MAIRIFAGESVIYRTAHLLSDGIDGFDKTCDVSAEVPCYTKEYSAECSMNKVYASEVLQYVADEAVQIHGGYGYIEDYPVERYYRDARIYRIFAGTNEINRLLIARLVLDKASGEKETRLLELLNKLSEGTLPIDKSVQENGVLSEQAGLVGHAKSIALMLLKLLLDTYPSDYEKQEQLMSVLSEIMMEVLAAESCLLRSQKIHRKWGSAKSEIPIAITTVQTEEAAMRIERWARLILSAIKDGGADRIELLALKAFRNRRPVDCLALRRKIADFQLEAGRYFVC
jgi:hypothetical protein